MQNPTPCRLFVILAREAPVGVIFRRGPSLLTQLIKWNTDTDTFEPGQWLHGRVYERQSDLSPDGSLLGYVASKSEHRGESLVKLTSWTAISHPPYYTALALWFFRGVVGEGGGGVMFKANNILWAGNLLEFSTPHEELQLPQAMKVDKSSRAHFTDWAYFERLQLYGWKHVQGANQWKGKTLSDHRIGHWKFGPFTRAIAADKAEIWEKPNKSHRYSLRSFTDKVLPNKRRGHVFQEKFSLIDSFVKPRSEIPLEGAEWADWDHGGRLVLAKAGKIFATEIADGQVKLRELADFNANQFQPLEAPEWATRW